MSCVPWAPDELPAWVERGEQAIDAEDVAAHRAMWSELREALPCLTGPLPTEPWAELLAGVALVEFASDGDWERPLTTALRLRPELAAELPETLAAFRPAAPLPPGPPLPADAGWRVDGVVVTGLPELPGLHVVQREVNGVFETRLVDDGVFPEAWRTPSAPPSAPAEVAARPLLVVAWGAGVSGEDQRSSEQNEHLPDEAESGLLAEVALRGRLGDDVALVLEGVGPFRTGGRLQVDALALGSVAAGPLDLEAGLALSTGSWRGPDEAQALFAMPWVGLATWAPLGAGHLVANLGGGASPGHAAAVAGRAGFVTAGAPGFWIGPDVAWRRFALEEQGGPLRLVATRWQVGVSAGVTLGRRS